MAILTKTAILKHLRNEQLVIDPFDIKNLSVDSYDVTLGEWFWVLAPKMPKEAVAFQPSTGIFAHPSAPPINHPSWDRVPLLDPYSNEFSASYRKYRATLWQSLCENFGISASSIPAEAEVFLLGPGETVMGHSQEFIGSCSHQFCTLLRTRSSLARLGISCGGSAGWGDAGFFGRWGIRITNHTQYAIPLIVGTRIAQIVFMETSAEEDNEELLYNGSYQVSDQSLEQIKNSWTPESLLPQLWKELKKLFPT